MRWAQKDIYNAGTSIAQAGLRLRGTEYEKAYKRLFKAMTVLNGMLIKDINKKK